MSLPEYSEVAGAGAVTVPAPDFDVRDFARTAVGSHRDNLRLDEYRNTPLSADTRRALSYLRVIERATMTHLRSVLVTAAHKDAQVTAFLVTWAYEKYWIADALEQILLSHEPEGTAPDKSAFRTPIERTVRESIIANIVGVPMIAVHMSLGTVDEWLTQAAYVRIAEIEQHPELATTITALHAVKKRQLSFFEAQSRLRLTVSSRARSVTRRRLATTAWPIGALAEPTENTRFFYDYLFAAEPRLLNELDARIDTLPGQSGLQLMRKAARL